MKKIGGAERSTDAKDSNGASVQPISEKSTESIRNEQGYLRYQEGNLTMA
jgi:hypothetical protein